MKKVLVIDDEKTTLNMFRLFLSVYGYQVLTAENGVDGLTIVDAEQPAIVFTDLKMPGIGGIEVLKRIKQQAAGTEVVVITGHGDIDLALQALDLGATDFINKPIQRTALEAALGRAENRLAAVPAPGTEARVVASGDEDVVIRFKGALSEAAAPALSSAFREASGIGTGRIVLDLDPAVSIDGQGLSLLTRLLESHRQREWIVAGIPVNFISIFERMGVDHVARIQSEPAGRLPSTSG